MKNPCKTLALFLALLLIPFSFPDSVHATESADALISTAAVLPSVSAQSAVLIDADSGRILFEKDAGEELPMASTTKVMTALVALDLANPDSLITVAKEAVGVEGSSVYLTLGEQLTLEQLLYALLLESANDAAVAVAVGLCGSVPAFADKMNEKAEALGLKQSHFCNPHGLDDEAHYTTASDLAKITCEALQNPLFSSIVSTKKTTIPHAGTDGVRLLINHNKLLRIYDGAIGVKTGFTKKSGRCLVSAAERDGVRLVCVTLNDPNDWQDHTALFDYGFSLCERVTLCRANELSLRLPVVGGEMEETVLTNCTECSVTLLQGHAEVRYCVEASRFLYAPAEAGDTAALAVFYCDTNGDGSEEIIASIPLTIQITVPKAVRKKSLWQWFKALFQKN